MLAAVSDALVMLATFGALGATMAVIRDDPKSGSVIRRIHVRSTSASLQNADAARADVSDLRASG
jgi:hypothetical protein